MFEPLGETIGLDVFKGCYELFHRTFGNHALDVRVSSKQVLEEKMFREEFDLGVREPNGETLEGLRVYDLLPSFAVLHHAFGYLFNGITPDGEDHTVSSFEREESTEMKASQRRNTKCLNDVLRDILPRYT